MDSRYLDSRYLEKNLDNFFEIDGELGGSATKQGLSY